MASELIRNLTKSKDELLHYLVIAEHVAREAGKIVHEAYNQSKNVTSKDCITDLVTETDKKVEAFIFDSLRTEFPNHCFIGEETVSDGGSCKLTDAPTWIVDPIDGTTNFIHRFPYVAVSIGLVINKQVQVGIVNAPMLDDFYSAVRGYGSYVNQKKLSVSKHAESLSQALVASEWGAGREESVMTAKSKNFFSSIFHPGVHGMRSTGSAALNMCLVGQGSLDLYFEHGPHCWDVAAGSLVLEEAGGVNADGLGGPFDLMGRTIICASNRSLIDEMLPHVTNLPQIRDDA